MPLKLKNALRFCFYVETRSCIGRKVRHIDFITELQVDIFNLLSFHVLMKIMVFAEFRTADELVQMIAHFYYNAKKPSCVNNANLCP